MVAGFAREDLFTVVLEHFQTDTADYADYMLPATTQLEHWDVHLSYGHTDVLLNRPAIAPLGEALPNTQIFRELAQRMGFTEACFAEDDESLCRSAYGDQVDFDQLLAQGFATLRGPRCAVRRRRISHGLGQVRILQRTAGRGRAWTACPTICPTTRRRGSSARYPAGDDLAAGAQLPQLQLRQRAQPARHRGRAAAGDPRERCRGARHRDRARWCASSTTAANTAARREVSDRARPGRGQRPGHLVAQARAGRHQRQPAHQPEADGHGARRPCSTTAWSKSSRREDAG